VRLPASLRVGEEGEGWTLAKVTLGNERVSLSSGGALWGDGPSAHDLLAQTHTSDALLRQRLAQLYIEAEILRLIRLRTVTAAVRGEAPGPEASIRKVMADEHGQKIMAIAKDLRGAAGMVNTPADIWDYGFLFSPALTIGGGTWAVQRNIIAERVLGLPHDVGIT
jgi:alkylation response protein AidB-like acyl-CoA dehydrogenase